MYRTDLAHIHHEGFSEFARSAAPGVIELLHRAGIHRGHIVEVGCGTGVLARTLAQAGYDVTAFDASAAMIDIARSATPEDLTPAPRFEAARLEDLTLPPCDAIIAMGGVLNYGDIRSFLPRAAAATRFLLFDVAEEKGFPEYEEYRGGGEDWSVIIIRERDGARLTRRVLTFRQIDGETHRDEEVHHLELYDRDEILRLLPDFRVRIRRSYGKRRLPKGHAVYVATR